MICFDFDDSSNELPRKKFAKDLVVIEKVPTFALANQNYGTRHYGSPELKQMIFERKSINFFVEKYKEDKFTAMYDLSGL